MTEYIDPIKPTEFEQADGLEDWRTLGDGAYAFFPTESFASSAQLVNAITELIGGEDRAPDVDIRPDGVTVRMLIVTNSFCGVTKQDQVMARRISTTARSLAISSDPSGLQSLLVIPGATSVSEVMPFWKAMLGYEPRPDSPNEDLVDRHGRGAPFWFEQMEQPRADGGGAVHIAIFVPYEQAQARIDAAIAAGGRMVRDESAPMWWTLADAAGNEADIATTRGRG